LFEQSAKQNKKTRICPRAST